MGQGPKKILLVIVGPTAVGKTSLSIQLGHHFNADIFSADSRQFFKEMNIGTAKPSLKELATVRHHFINNLSILQEYDVGKYEIDAVKAIEVNLQYHDLAILTGGSGMYIKAVTHGFDDMPEPDTQIRENLNKMLIDDGLDELQAKLEAVDPEYFREVDLQNPQRIIRALEVFMVSGKPFSAYRKGNAKERKFKIIKIGLEMERAELYERIDQRMDAMIADGLFEEAENLLPFRHHNALQTVGYKEIFDFFDGKYDREEAVRLVKRNSRRYAKRQMTWFKKDSEIAWFHPDQVGEIIKYVEGKFVQKK
ncbi:MAG: tRNA (adenosine(37)-N6)-dimethylallyltransferase MiaA [Bacteroidota bacterium]|nr:tRNA (adenosine(37)-N6)-dimethylallyltransferase MiaA [Bacteroidota bacterium]